MGTEERDQNQHPDEDVPDGEGEDGPGYDPELAHAEQERDEEELGSEG